MKQTTITLVKSAAGYNITLANKPLYRAPVSAERIVKAIVALAAMVQ